MMGVQTACKGIGEGDEVAEEELGQGNSSGQVFPGQKNYPQLRKNPAQQRVC